MIRPLLLLTGALALPAADSDPLAQWCRGRVLFQHEFSPSEGAGEPTHLLRRADGRPAVDMGRAASCALCHNTPLDDAGAGPSIRRAGVGRNTPHLFGAGAREQLAQAITASLIAQADRNGDGLIGPVDAPYPHPVVNGVRFGEWVGKDGQPALDPAIILLPMASDGCVLASASDTRFVGWRVAVPAFGWGERPGHPAIDGTSLRAFIDGAAVQHAGLQADDPALRDARSPFGAAQLPHTPIDPGHRRDADGRSLDDPDGDGVYAELDRAACDALERYHLDHPEPPPPVFDVQADQGRAHFTAIGCASCHAPDWDFPDIPDRRALAWTWDATGAHPAPRPSGHLSVRGIYTDFRSHDLGPALHIRQDDGTVITRVRTPPLWGVASTGPWLHDGRALDLDSAIRAHGGYASASATAYANGSAADRAALLAFLGALKLQAVGPVSPAP
jgi:hypothetical protein